MNTPINTIAAINNQAVAVIQYKGLPVVTSEMLADFYGTDTDNIKQNSSRNADKFIDGKHFFKLEGLELRDFKDMVTNGHYVPKNTARLTLWTERGAMRHAKLLETDRAWEVFEQLEDSYFRCKQSALATPQDLPTALRLAADLAEQKAVVEQQLAIAEPKAIALDQIADTTSLFTIRETAKMIKSKERELVNELLRRGWVYRDKRDALQPYAEKIAAGYVTTVMTAPVKRASGKVFSQLRITAKGVTRLGYLAAKGVAA